MEKEIFIKYENMEGAIQNLMATYFVFNIVHPNPVFIIMQQHNLKKLDKQPEPNSVSILLTGLIKLAIKYLKIICTCMHANV